MSGLSRIFSLCGFIIILSLLQGSCSAAGYNCSPFAMYSKCSRSVQWQVLGSSNHFEKYSIVAAYKKQDFEEYALVYVLIDILPLMIYFPLLVLFNADLASGPAQSFVFFYNVTSTAVVTLPLPYFALIWGLLTMQSPINDQVVFPFIYEQVPVLPFPALQYCKLVIVVLVIVTTVALVKCVACPCASWRRPWAKFRRSVRHFRRKRAQKGTVLDGLCSIAILTYGFVIQQSFTVLRPTKCSPDDNKSCLFYCRELKYFDTCNVPFFLLAVISLVLVLPLPLFLLYYPCVPALMQRITKRSSPLITCHKLAPVFDVFQSAYKPKLRFFAAFPLLYRYVIWMLFSTLSTVLTNTDKQLIITLVFILILAIHSLIQPYSKPRHNYIETLYLVNLVLISALSTVFFNSLIIQQFSGIQDNSPIRFVVLYLLLLLTLLPILVGIGYICKCCCVYCKSMQMRQNRRESVEDNNEQVLPSETYLDLDDEDSMEQTALL